MEEKTKFDKKIFMLIVLIVLLGTSTYAWFTTNKNVRIDGIHVQVATSGNLEISADAVNWKTVIDTTDLLENVKTNYASAENQIPRQGLYPMSTAGNINNGRLDMFFGKVQTDAETGDYSLTATKEVETQGNSGKFIAFDIFLRVSQDTTVYLNPSSQIASTGLNNPNQSTGIENATRIAILKQGNGETAAQVQNLKGATSATIIEPNYDVHTQTGINNAQNIYGISNLQTTGNVALQYYGIRQAFTTGRPLNDKTSTYFSVVNPAIKLERSFFYGENRRELFNLNKGITKIRIYMWVEGQDVDCEDYASGANLKFDFQLGT